MRLVVLFCAVILLVFCSSGPTTTATTGTIGLLYERNPIDKEAAVAHSGQVVYSKARVGSGVGRAKVIYSHYIFQGATKTELQLSYEEHYDRTKQQADLKELKSVPYPNGEVFLDEIKLVLYRVTPTYIEYKVEAVK